MQPSTLYERYKKAYPAAQGLFLRLMLHQVRGHFAGDGPAILRKLPMALSGIDPPLLSKTDPANFSQEVTAEERFSLGGSRSAWQMPHGRLTITLYHAGRLRRTGSNR